MRNFRWPIHGLVFMAASGLMLGILAAKFGAWEIGWLGLLTLPFIFRRRLLAFVPVLLIFFALGHAKALITANRLDTIRSFIGQNVVLSGKIANDPVYHESGQFEFRVDQVVINEHPAPGVYRVRVFTPRVLRGDTIHVSGKLYDGFGPIRGTISYGDLSVVQAASSPVEAFRSKFMSAFRSLVPDPESSLALGFLLGTRSILPDTMTTALAATGLTHIVAVSGYNLTILVGLTRRIFARFSRAMSVMAGLGLLGIFMALAGGSPSIYRASVVSLLALLSWYVGRKTRPMVVLWVSAAVTSYLEPLYIWGDIGWYLSFCAFFGVLVLAPLLAKRLYKSTQPGLIGSIVLETSMAQLATLPLIMLIFGDVSVVSLLANILVLPLIPLAMLVSFVGGMSALLIPSIAGWLSWPIRIVMGYLVNVIALLAQLPGALRSLRVDYVGFLLLWSAIFLLWMGLVRAAKNRPRPTNQQMEQL